MRALVIGASGLTGSALMRALDQAGLDAVGTFRQRPRPGLVPLDVTDGQAVAEMIAAARPQLIFLAAALVLAERCEDDPRMAFEVNAEGAYHVALAAASQHAKLVFYSTDAIFDGEQGPYAENDAPNPLSVYGRTKLAAEQVITETLPDHLIIRTTTVFGWDRDSKNFAMQLWERLRTGDPLRVPNDQWGNPTLVDYLAQTSVRLAQDGRAGVLNVVGKDHMPRSEFACRLAANLGLDRDLIMPVPFREAGRRAFVPLQAGLRTDRLRATLGREPMTLDEALSHFRSQWQADTQTANR